ncbi:septum site-determining protein Ssd [uncultured Pseudokineococcus sp.]|uniref:septum site-determining protein Ssd n=1 Tax=uncultured Pseudokineococcus sp. TaxID=1642928 RepID=UPI002610F30B|nr:septum site-determining protein Ssd [uncultured Pseudokineococcus sp.]
MGSSGRAGGPGGGWDVETGAGMSPRAGARSAAGQEPPGAGDRGEEAPPAVVLVAASAWVVEQVGRCAAATGALVHVVDPRAPVAPPAGARLELWDAGALAGAGDQGPPAGVRRLVVADATAPEALWRRAMAAGAVAVLLLPQDEEALVDALLEAADPRPADALVVGVAGGCGGAGASVLALLLALAAARGPGPSPSPDARSGGAGRRARVLLADLDPLGCGADVLVGAEGREGLRWEDLHGVRGALAAHVLDGALPHRAGVDLLVPGRTGGCVGGSRAAGVPAEASAAVLAAARRSHDVVVLDLPRAGHGAEHLVAACSPLLLVVPADVPSTLAAARALARLGPRTGGTLGPADVRLVVRTGPAGSEAPRARDVGAALARPVAAVVPHDPVVARRAAAGSLLAHRSRRGAAAAAAELLAGLVDRSAGPAGARRAAPAAASSPALVSVRASVRGPAASGPRSSGPVPSDPTPSGAGRATTPGGSSAPSGGWRPVPAGPVPC